MQLMFIFVRRMKKNIFFFVDDSLKFGWINININININISIINDKINDNSHGNVTTESFEFVEL